MLSVLFERKKKAIGTQKLLVAVCDIIATDIIEK